MISAILIYLAGAISTGLLGYLSNRNPHFIKVMQGKLKLQPEGAILILLSWLGVFAILAANIVSLLITLKIPKLFTDWFENNKENK